MFTMLFFEDQLF